MYNTVIPYFYTLQNNHNKSSYHLLLYKFIAMLLTIFPRPHVTFLVTYLLCNWKFLSLTLLHLFHPCLLCLPLADICLFSVSMTLFVYVFHLFYFLDSTCKWKSYGICLLWLAYFLWHKILYVHSRSIYVVTNVKISFFFMADNILYPLYPFIYQGTLRLLPYFGYCG